MKIITSHDFPPIPTRDMDWSAHTSNYEASYEGDGHWTSNEPIGHGTTEQAAVDDLLDQLEDDESYGKLVEQIRAKKGLSDQPTRKRAMNSILRYVVMPWKLLSGMGNWSYAVVTEWQGRPGEVTPGSAPPEIFDTKDAAKNYARKQASEWPYRSEVCFLHPDTGKYILLQ